MKFFRMRRKHQADSADILEHESADITKQLVDPHKVKGPSQDGVKFANVSDIKVIFPGDKGGFAVALGNWEDASCGFAEPTKMLLMRWNGCQESDRGFPAAPAAGQWFPIPTMFSHAVIATLRDRLDELDPEGLAEDYGFLNDRP